MPRRATQVLEKWNQQSALAHPWTVADLLSSQVAAGRHVSLIIDLSNHDTLYADEVPPSLAYVHIKLVAKVPSSPQLTYSLAPFADGACSTILATVLLKASQGAHVCPDALK